MLQPGFLWAPLQQNVRVVGGRGSEEGPLPRSSGAAECVHMLRVLWHFCPSQDNASWGEAAGRSFQVDLSVGKLMADVGPANGWPICRNVCTLVSQCGLR